MRSCDPAAGQQEHAYLEVRRKMAAASERERHGTGWSYHPGIPPDVVAFAQSIEEVSDIVKLCARHKIPIIPFGTGTSLEGHVAASRGRGVY